MALMFHNTFPPSYYKQLHRYVHQNYHKHLAKNSLVKLLNNPLNINTKSLLLQSLTPVFYHAPATFIEEFKIKTAGGGVTMKTISANINEQLAKRGVY